MSFKKIERTHTELPIDSHLNAITQLLRENSSLILKATPGSGKTTRVPPALLNSFGGGIIVLEPRRVAARMAAQRVSEEMGSHVGECVGYQFRFESKVSSQTQITFLTEGLLLRKIKSHPNLDGIRVVILDEFHERHIQGDVALALLVHLQKTSRPDLKIVVMSATLEMKNLEEYLPRSASYTVETVLYEVEIKYLDKPPVKALPELVRNAVDRAMVGVGDILVFLPGQKEIHQALRELETLNLRECEVLPLYGELPMADQVKALVSRGLKRIILSTNIAETSLTIEGVTTVIDSGLHKQARWSQWSGIPTLETKSISRSSATQRAGRAGRLSKGTCYRLYTMTDFKNRLEFDRAEIHRVDITALALDIAALGWGLGQEFPWFEKPAAHDWKQAKDLLAFLGAIEHGRITDVGREMSEYGLPPRLGRVLVEAKKTKATKNVLRIIVGLEEGNLKSQNVREWVGEKLHTREQKLFERLDPGLSSATPILTDKDINAFLAGYADKLQKVDSRFEIVLEAHEVRDKSRTTRRAVAVLPIAMELLEAHPQVEIFEEISWNHELKKVEKWSGLKLYESVLWREKEAISEGDSAAASVFLKEGLGIDLNKIKTVNDLLSSLTHSIPVDAIRNDLARIQHLSKQKGYESLKKVFTTFDWFKELLKDKLSVETLKSNSWFQEILAITLEKEESARAIEMLMPTVIEIGSRKNVKINYDFDKPPWVESRLQDFFGMSQGPRIANGQIPLTLHLLAPNMRAVQVTDDLASFWKVHYPKLKIELKRRYPRHKWPEDPLHPIPST